MLTKQQADVLVKKAFPKADIKFMTAYNNLFIYRIYKTDDPIEGRFDPFHSVDQKTGLIRDFSILTDMSLSEANRLFLKD